MSEIFSTGRETTDKRTNKQTDLTHEKDVIQGAMRKETNDNAVWDICLCPMSVGAEFAALPWQR